MNPIGHLGVTVGLGRVLRLNFLVAGVAVMLPDLVDKPLTLLGVGDGRYIGHSLIFVVGVGLLFGLRNWRYGVSAGIAGLSHLLEDLGAPIPWCCPFVKYEPSGASFSVTASLTSTSWETLVPDVVGFLILAYLAVAWVRAKRAKALRRRA